VPKLAGDERANLPPLTNPRAERVMAVRRLSGRSARLRDGRFVVEGPQAVREAVAAQRQPLPGIVGSAQAAGALLELYATPSAVQRHPQILADAARVGVFARTVTDEVLAAMADTVTPQGLLAVCRLLDVPLDRVLGSRLRLVAVLAAVRDPGNAGTVIRAADAAGADAVILTDASVDVHNPKCVRSTAGSLFHLPVVSGVPLVTAASALRSAGLSVYAADGSGETDLDTVLDGADGADAASGAGGGTGPDGQVAWVFGNEAWGLPQAHRRLADAVVRVPIHGRAESLNLAMAATVCLYATARAQRRPARPG
jgi:RNA methyltransferase, TrmH family